jgi:hypothetical protein
MSKNLFHRSWKVLLMGGVSLALAFVMALLLESALIPNPCLYHTPEYLGSKELPWWIRTFLPLNAGLHPEAGFLYYALFGLLGTAGLYILFQDIELAE